MDLVVITNRRFKIDPRKYLVRCVEALGNVAIHVYCWETIEITFGDREVKRFSTTDLAAYDCIRTLLRDREVLVLTGLGGYVNEFAFRAREFLPHALFVYDVYDDFTYGATGRNLSQRIRWDLQWRSFCDLVVVKEEGLKRRYPNAYFLANASHLRPSPNRNRRDARRLVYTGSIDHRVDFNWLDRLANEDVLLDVYGWIHIDATSDARRALESFLHRHNNVTYKGLYDDDDLPRILPDYGTGLVPYKKHHRMTAHVNPNKAGHYLNAGLEVIATPIPQMKRLDGYAHLVEIKGNFHDVLNRVSQFPKATAWPAENYTWELRWAELLAIASSFRR